MRKTRWVTTFFAGALLLGLAPQARAQIDDNRWLPFIGCWEPSGETPEAGLLCFRPGQGGVEMTSVVAGEVVATETLISDGERRPIVAEGCEGFESVSFSEDGRRVFTRSDITCGDDERPGTGVMAVVAPTRWVDVRALEMQGETVAWVQVYQLVGLDRLAEEGVEDPVAGIEGSVSASRLVASRDIGVDDVTEAIEVVDEKAVEAWIAAQGGHFDLQGQQLLALAESGVPESVIDVMIAVSYPSHFTVGAEQRVAQADPRPTGRRIPIGVGYRSYMMWDPFYFGYGIGPRFGFGYRSSYLGYGYGYPYRYGYGGYGYGPTIIRVDRRAPEGGRAVFGRGWTRSSGGSGGRVARPGGGGSTSGGYVGGSSGGSRGTASSGGGRRAKPRGSR